MTNVTLNSLRLKILSNKYLPGNTLLLLTFSTFRQITRHISFDQLLAHSFYGKREIMKPSHVLFIYLSSIMCYKDFWRLYDTCPANIWHRFMNFFASARSEIRKLVMFVT